MKGLIRMIWQAPTGEVLVRTQPYNRNHDLGVNEFIEQMQTHEICLDSALKDAKMIAIEQEGYTQLGKFWKQELMIREPKG